MGFLKRFWLPIGIVILLVLLAQRFPGALDENGNVASIIYALMLLALIGPGAFYTFRRFPGRSFRHLLLWGVLFILIFAVAAYREQLATIGNHLMGQLVPSEPRGSAGGEIVLTRATDGHFYADAFVNGKRVRFLVDTGASRVVLSQDDAERIGLDPASLHYTQPVGTANGMAMNAAVRLDYIMLGNIRVEDVRAGVTRSGAMDGSLLGMSFLERLGGYRIEGDTLYLWVKEK